MTPQERATAMLTLWQLQRAAGIPAEARRLPSPANDRDSYERVLDAVRDVVSEREQPCFACGGNCGFDDGERCDDCNGTGTEWAEPQPMTADDLSEMCGDPL